MKAFNRASDIEIRRNTKEFKENYLNFQLNKA